MTNEIFWISDHSNNTPTFLQMLYYSSMRFSHKHKALGKNGWLGRLKLLKRRSEIMNKWTPKKTNLLPKINKMDNTDNLPETTEIDKIDKN